MEDFENLVLCDTYSEQIDIHVYAEIKNGCLTVYGQDLGPNVERFWGSDEYEYWYILDRENTTKLLKLIGGITNPKAALLSRFSGEAGCRTLRKLCDENEIEYKFDSFA